MLDSPPSSPSLFVGVLFAVVGGKVCRFSISFLAPTVREKKENLNLKEATRARGEDVTTTCAPTTTIMYGVDTIHHDDRIPPPLPRECQQRLHTIRL